MSKGSLYKILHTKSFVVDWELRIKFALDICEGMRYLHKCKPAIVHRDLKSHNLLVNDELRVKVCDFGLARLMQNNLTTGTMTSCGTPAWTAPEGIKMIFLWFVENKNIN